MNNRKIGFDILEDQDLRGIELLGAGYPDVSSDARKRMLRIARKKYSEAVRNGIDLSSPAPAFEDGSVVSGVEQYGRKGISRSVYRFVGAAAALVIVAGSLLMLHNNAAKVPQLPNPIAVSTETQTGTTSSEPANTIITDDAAVTVTTTSTDESQTGYSADAEDTSTTTTSVSAAAAVVSGGSGNGNGNSPSAPAQARDIPSAQQQQSAAIAALDDFVANGIFAFNIGYYMYDVNGDGVQELFIEGSNNMCEMTYVYIYENGGYVPAPEVRLPYGSTAFETQNANAMFAAVCPEEHIIELSSKEGGMWGSILRINDNGQCETIELYSSQGVFKKSGDSYVQVSGDEASSLYINNREKYHWVEPQAAFYADYNNEYLNWSNEMSSRYIGDGYEHSASIDIRINDNMNSSLTLFANVVRTSSGVSETFYPVQHDYDAGYNTFTIPYEYGSANVELYAQYNSGETVYLGYGTFDFTDYTFSYKTFDRSIISTVHFYYLYE